MHLIDSKVATATGRAVESSAIGERDGVPTSSASQPAGRRAAPAAVTSALGDVQDIDDHRVFLSTVSPSRRDWLLATTIALLSLLAFVAVAPFAKLQLPVVPAFIPAYESALLINDLITAILLFGQFGILRSRALLVLAGGYLFNALMAVPHALTFPGVFAPQGLLGAGPQTTAWLYISWHILFPLIVITYALLKQGQGVITTTISARAAVIGTALAVVCTVTGLTLAAIRAEAELPLILSGLHYTPTAIFSLAVIGAVSLLSLIVLWMRHPHSLLDVWLMVVMCAWLFDVGLSAVLNNGRYDLGFYAGRIYVVLGASFVLALILVETTRLYTRLAGAAKRVTDYAATLEASVRARTIELQRSNEALSESERRFQDIAEVSGDWMWETDREHRFTLLLGQSTSALPVRPGSLIGRTRWDAAGADLVTDEPWARHKTDLDAHEAFRHFRYELRSPDGAHMFISASGKPVFDEANNFLGYRGTATDETAIVNTQHRAEAAEALLRDAIESISGGFLICDPEDRVVLFNQRFHESFEDCADILRPGVRYEDFLREAVRRGCYPRAVGCEDAWYAERLARHREANTEIAILLREDRWVLVNDRRMSNGGIAMVSTDITVLKAAQKALAEREQQLNRAQRLARMGIDLRDLRSGRREWSDESYRIFGVGRETFAITPENVFSLVHPEDRPIVLAGRTETAAGTCPEPFECRIVRPDGEVRHVHREWELIRDEAGNPAQLLGTIQDITDRRRTEEQLRQAQKMEAIGNLTGGMAHDFNNLLGVVIGNLDLLRDLRKDDGEADELARDALDAAVRGADLTRRLLAFARQQPLQAKRVEVNDLVSGITKLLSRTLGEHIEISLKLAVDVWPCVVDPAQLEASLTNLATNARDAMPHGGKLMVVTANRALDADYAALHAEVTPGDYVMIELSDTGTGMPPAVMEHIFEPFYTTKERGKGTGLGLSMVFGFLKQSAGHINVYSEVGTGTTFRLYLPRMMVEVGSAEERAPSRLVGGQGETVLAVEDNAALRRVVFRQLTELGYRVLEAENAGAAIAMLEQQSVDLLLTDIVMPGGTDGIELAREAQQRWPKIRAVFTSGFPENSLNGGARTLAPGTRLLSKPYRKEDLASAVRAALDG